MAIRGNIAVGFHYGRTLLHLADSYARPTQVILELIQNAIDAGAKNIYLKVVAGRASRQRIIYCADDGAGASFEELEQRFQRISEQQKTGKIGHKGIGNLASLAIAEGFSLTTRPGGPLATRERYFTIKLSRTGLEEMAEGVTLPYLRETKEFRPGAEHKLATDFGISTLLIVQGVRQAALRQLADASTIAQTIENRFAPQILERKIRIWVDAGGHRLLVQPAAFPGTPETTEIETLSGTVRFEIFVGTKPVKTPKLAVIHGKTPEEQYAIPFGPFLEISPAVREVFNSGLLQGNVYVPFCRLTPDREEFEYDDELSAFWEALETYAKLYGRKILERISEEKRDVKIAQVLLGALRRLEKFLAGHREEFIPLFRGQVSEGHFGAENGELAEPLRSVEPTRRGPRQPGEPRPGPKSEQKRRIHSGVTDSGSRRRVYNRQLGIQVEYRDPRPEEGRDWLSKREGSKIILNSLNPLWQAVESDSQAHTQYCFLLMLKELILAPQDEGPAKEFFNDTFEHNYMPALVETLA